MVVNGLLVHKAEKNNHPTKWRRTIYFVYVKNGTSFGQDGQLKGNY